MEDLQNLKYMSQKEDYMCKLDLKGAYFSVPLDKISRQFVRFRWSGNLYEFLCLCFGLRPAPRMFTKLLKVPMTILRKINIKIIIYLEDMLLIGHSLEEIIMSRETVTFLLHCHLETFIKQNKTKQNKTKNQKIASECQNLINNPQTSTSILEFTRLIGLLTSTIQAVLPARLNYRFLQMQQTSSLSENLSYLDKIVLSKNSKIELKRVQNLELCNGWTLIQPPAEVLIQTDTSTKGWGSTCNVI